MTVEIPSPDTVVAPGANSVPEALVLDSNITVAPPVGGPPDETPTRLEPSPLENKPNGDELRLVKPSPESNHSFQRLDPRFIKMERLGWWILTAIVASILFVGWCVTGIFFRGFDLIQWCLLLPVPLTLCAGWFFSRYFPAKTYDSTSWQLKPAGLEIRHGIWWRHRIFIPRDRIQHTDVQQGPIMRMYGLANLVINTGGTHEPSIPLGGISLEVAQQLRDQLTPRAMHEKSVATAEDGA